MSVRRTNAQLLTKLKNADAEFADPIALENPMNWHRRTYPVMLRSDVGNHSIYNAPGLITALQHKAVSPTTRRDLHDWRNGELVAVQYTDTSEDAQWARDTEAYLHAHGITPAEHMPPEAQLSFSRPAANASPQPRLQPQQVRLHQSLQLPPRQQQQPQPQASWWQQLPHQNGNIIRGENGNPHLFV